ncbi:hypothetical protein EUTSA_v10022242mg [Eutrema salsugineum]|uniref:UBC core domain-containing protein n=1 Tax=Eutrema salsugineum TaxID=72664 RepID=V4M1P4_EUTSA|nr:probable ubiquitin-conjugating enzyme E2 23 [Eutrema salsugineum]ESQ48747.1 hypothetical protein EUTSA_v10022242mg [Eutrema salsugineum]
MTKGVDVFSCDSDDDDLASKPRVPLAKLSRSKSDRYRGRAEKVSQKVIPESKSGSEEEVGDIVHLGHSSYFIIDIFEKEIMELGDKVDLNFKRFKKFEALDGDAPRDHHFYNYRCCYSCFCLCVNGNVEGLWGILERELDSREKKDGWKGISFFVRTYRERKELMRVAVTDQSHSLFFFDLKFPNNYPSQAPEFFYHPYGLPLSTPETLIPSGSKHGYSILDVFRYIEEIVMMNTNKSCHQMLDMLKRPLMGFEDFVKGHFRKKGPLILRNMMDEMDMEKERDKTMFLKTYVAFEDNKAYCEHLLDSGLKEELKRYKEKECSQSDYYYSSSSPYFPTIISRFDDIKKTSKYQNLLSKFSFFD